MYLNIFVLSKMLLSHHAFYVTGVYKSHVYTQIYVPCIYSMYAHLAISIEHMIKLSITTGVSVYIDPLRSLTPGTGVKIHEVSQPTSGASSSMGVIISLLGYLSGFKHPLVS